MSLLSWVTRLVFGAAAPAVEEVAREASDLLVSLQDDGTRPMPLPSKAVAHQQAQIASAAHAFPPSCPPSLPPSAPPEAAKAPSSVPSHRVLPAPPSSQSRPSSGPPPPLPPVRLVPAPPRPVRPPPPVFPRPPRPLRRR